jgi:prepilin-type N-terminal cleavage/methylation domain-containing protein
MRIARQSILFRRGFTLMEVIIAVIAFAIVLAAINAVFYGALRLRNKTVTSFDEALPLQQTLAIIKRDLANIVLPGGVLSGSLQTTPTSGLKTGSSSTSTGTGTAIMPGQVSPNFYTATGIADETSPFAEIEKISYLLTDSTNRTAGRDLVRSVTRNLLPSLQEQPVQQSLMSGVQAMTFFFYDGSQWRNTWDSTTADPKTGLTNTLPQAIKVQLALASEQTGRWTPAPIELIVPVVVQARTNATSQASGGGP